MGKGKLCLIGTEEHKSNDKKAMTKKEQLKQEVNNYIDLRNKDITYYYEKLFETENEVYQDIYHALISNIESQINQLEKLLCKYGLD